MRKPLHFAHHDVIVAENGLTYLRGRYDEHIVMLTVFGHAFMIETRGKSLRKLLDVARLPDDVDQIIDEFGTHFDNLAIASLRFARDMSATQCTPETYARYTDLIERLGKPMPPFGPRIKDWEKRIDAARHDFVDALRDLY